MRRSKAAEIDAGDVVVIRYEGPKGGPGMREMLNPTSAIAGMGLGSSVALITDGRFQRSLQRRVDRTRFAGGGSRRTDRTGRRGRQDQDRYPELKSGAGCTAGYTGCKTRGMAAERAESKDRVSGKICFYGDLRQPWSNTGSTKESIGGVSDATAYRSRDRH